MSAKPNIAEEKENAFLFVLEQLLWAEDFLLENLLEIKEGAFSPDLVKLVEDYYQATVLHGQQLQQMFKTVEKEPIAKGMRKCIWANRRDVRLFQAISKSH